RARIAIAGVVPEPDIVVVAGEKSLRTARRSGYGDRVLRAHNLDYDIFLRFAQDRSASAGRRLVFLDQDLCFHPDFIYTKTPFVVTPEQYFPRIRDGLRRMASVFGLEPCVAAHPRASYRRSESDYFGGIPIEYGRTAELIGAAGLVVCHNSAAIQLAVLFGKPIVFITTNQLAASDLGRYVDHFAAVLGKRVINLDSDLDTVDWDRELAVDHDR